MSFEITHRKKDIKADGPDSTLVRPSDWNDTHKIVMSAGVLGRTQNTGTGDVEVLPIYVDQNGITKFDMKAGLWLPGGTEGQRPLVPQEGVIRYNADTKRVEAYLNGVWEAIQIGSDYKVPTGTYIYTFDPNPITGWVVAYGTIGKEGSTALNRANSDTLPLYKLLWENFPDSFATVAGGRGAVAEEDFNALKTMMLPDLRETVIAAAGDIGGSEGAVSNGRLRTPAADFVVDGFAEEVSAGTFAGLKHNILTIAQLAKHSHTYSPSKKDVNTASVTGTPWFGGSDDQTSEVGEDKPHNNVQPTVLLNALIKL